MKTFDALVIGGGPAGATTALALAQAGRSVAVVEKASFPRRKVCGEFVSAPTWALLRDLGVADSLLPLAGPPVSRVGLYAGPHRVEAAMPGSGEGLCGRAIGRHHLDTRLLQAAAANGAKVFQPATVESVARVEARHVARIEGSGGAMEISAGLVIDTHGSWQAGPFGSVAPTAEHDLLGFKARFTGASLPRGLMPLVLFPGGYGGLVETDGGAVSFSCCIRHGTLRRVRAGHANAGDAVLAHVAARNRGFREALAGARLEGPWLAAGPIRPGFRTLHHEGVFTAGNAAGEAHPIVAEGIAMAIQSGWLLARQLAANAPDEAAVAYRRDWRRHFALRIHAAQAFATLGASAAAPAFVGTVRLVPAALTLGAWASGKVFPLHRPEPA